MTTSQRTQKALSILVVVVTVWGAASAIVYGSERPAHEAEPRGPYLRVLGTAQDGGYPHAACSCVRCRLAREQPDRARLVASLALVLPRQERVYLIDATPDIRRQLDRLEDVRRPPQDRVDRAPVDGIFLTHAHIGHYLGLAFLGFEAIHTSALPLWATPSLAAFLRSNGPWGQLLGKENVELIELGDAPVMLAEDVRVERILVPHRDEYTDTVGYRIVGPERTVLYVPDTDPWRAWSPPLVEALADVDVALLDGAFYSADELPGRRVEDIRHPLITDSVERLQPLVDSAGLEVYFTHLNHSNPLLDQDSAEKAAIEAKGFRVLSDLEEIDL